MVQYVFTPWRDRHELLLVRQQFYGPSSPTPATEAQQSTSTGDGGDDGPGAEDGAAGAREDQHRAVARASMWMQRGNCPHMVESTALLMAAVLSDEAHSAAANAASSTYAVRAAYSAAFSRFVTGLLDGHQEKLRKQSMYSLAKTIGLPATFVELRHQATHEQLPSLARLRSAAQKALLWIWGYYWKHLGPATTSPQSASASVAARDRARGGGDYRELVMAYLREDDEGASARLITRMKEGRDLEGILRTVGELQETLPGNKAFLKCLKLSRELVEAMAADGQDHGLRREEGDEDRNEDKNEDENEDKNEDKNEEEKGIRAEHDAMQEKDEAGETAMEEHKGGLDSTEDTGWSPHVGVWIPKPIGIV